MMHNSLYRVTIELGEEEFEVPVTAPDKQGAAIIAQSNHDPGAFRNIPHIINVEKVRNNA